MQIPIIKIQNIPLILSPPDKDGYICKQKDMVGLFGWKYLTFANFTKAYDHLDVMLDPIPMSSPQH